MAELDPTTVENFRRALESTGLSTEKINKVLGQFGDSMKFVTVSAKDINKGLRDLNKEVKTGSKTYKDIGGDLFAYQKQIKDITDEKGRERAQTHLNLLAQKSFNDNLIDGSKKIGTTLVAGLYNYYKQQVMTGIRGLQGDGSPFAVAADLQSAAVDSAAQATSKVAGVIGGVGTALSAIPHPAAQVAGALASLGAGILDSGAKEAAELLKFSIEVTAKELEKTVKSFQQATGAGAMFAGGITELRSQAKTAGLEQGQFSKAIADNREALASFGGNVTDGARKLAAVGKESMQFRKSLLNLGISVEEQIQGQADYMSILQQTGQLSGRSNAELAKGSNDYLVNLKAISSFTGEDVKRAQARAKEASSQAAVQAKLMELGGDANLKFQNAVSSLGPEMSKAAQQLLAYGEVTDQATATFLAQNPEAMRVLQKTVADVSNANVSATDAISNYQSNMKQAAAVGMEAAKESSKALGTASLAVGAHGEAAKMSASFTSQLIKAQQQGAKSTTEMAKEAGETTDPLTKGVSESVVALQDMKIAIQDMMTGPITNFANQVPKVLEGLKNKLVELGLFKEESTVAAEKAKTETKQNYDKAFEGAGFLQKYFQIGMTEQQKEASKQYYGARGFDKGTSAEFDVGMPQYANGGIASGPTTGYKAMLHGTEAVIPLPDGKSVPIDMSNALEELKQSLSTMLTAPAQIAAPRESGDTSAIMQEQVSVLREIREVLASSKDLQQQYVYNTYN